MRRLAPRFQASPPVASATGIVAEISDDEGATVVIFAERLPRGTRVRVHAADERRLVALLARAADGATEESLDSAQATSGHELLTTFILGK